MIKIKNGKITAEYEVTKDDIFRTLRNVSRDNIDSVLHHNVHPKLGRAYDKGARGSELLSVYNNLPNPGNRTLSEALVYKFKEAVVNDMINKAFPKRTLFGRIKDLFSRLK